MKLSERITILKRTVASTLDYLVRDYLFPFVRYLAITMSVSESSDLGSLSDIDIPSDFEVENDEGAIEIDSLSWKSFGSSSSSRLELHKAVRTFVFRPYRLVRVRLSSPKSLRPSPRSGHRIVCTESEIYCLGGFNPTMEQAAGGYRIGGRLFRELWKYNIATNNWLLVMTDETVNMPTELASNSFIEYKNALIAYGGTGYPFGLSCSCQSYVFNTKRRDITRLEAEGELPTPQYGAAIVMHDDCLYTIGGTTGFDYSCDVYRLDLRTKQWENLYTSRPEMRDDPEGRYRHEIAYDGKFIYILGGGTSQMSFDMEELPAFDLQKRRWVYYRTLPDPAFEGALGYPMPRKCHSLVQQKTEHGYEAIIVGGLADDQVALKDIWKLDLKSMQWTQLKISEMKTPTYFHSAATPGNGCMYIFGGISSQEEQTRTNNMYKMWTTIPKLSEMCWEAVTHYDQELDRYSQRELCQKGIPEKFARRVPSLLADSKSNKKSDSTIDSPSPLKRCRRLND